MNLIEAIVDTITGICDTTPKGQGKSWPKQTPWPKDGTPDAKPVTHWTDLII